MTSEIPQPTLQEIADAFRDRRKTHCELCGEPYRQPYVNQPLPEPTTATFGSPDRIFTPVETI